MIRTMTVRFFAVILTYIVLQGAVGTVACAETKSVGFVASGTTFDDDSFNQMVISGLRQLQKEYDLVIEAKAGGFDLQSVMETLEYFAQKKTDVIVVNSASWHDKIIEFASKYPSLIFIINDSREKGGKNVLSIDYDQAMGSCLVGALCAWQSKTGQVGFIGGNELPVIQEFLCGFKKGVALSETDVQVEVGFVRSGSSEEGFEDPRQANLLAKRMYASGVDIIYSVAGLSGNGIIQAARKSGNYVVGVDSDQDFMAKGYVLTSMMKRLDAAVYHEVLSVIEGKFVPGVRVYDLSNGGVALTDMKYTMQLISKDVLEKLDHLKARLVSGEIQLDCSKQ